MPYCCVCHQTVNAWKPHPHHDQRSAFMTLMRTVGSDLSVYQCPACGCTDRDRHLWLYLERAGILEQLPGMAVLHLAPERALEPCLAAMGLGEYVRGDLHPQQPQHLKLDAEALPFEDGRFDLIIANHILEHVLHPHQAVAEFARCLKPGGVLVAQTPYAPTMKHTFELTVATSPEFAKLYFGQDDHLRLFGADIAGLFHAAGLQGELLAHDAVLADVDARQAGCNAQEPFFGFSKPLMALAQAA
jgi:SAM-dependent methyltransferase